MPIIPPPVDFSAIGQNVLPATDDTYDLGSAAKRFRKAIFSERIRVSGDENGSTLTHGYLSLNPDTDGIALIAQQADENSPTKDPAPILVAGKYWNGAASASVAIQLELDVENDSPLAYALYFHDLRIGNVIKFDHLGRVYIGPPLATRPLIAVDNVNVAAVGNVGSGEDNLITHDLAASLLVADGQGVKITAWGIFANNANAKTLKIYFGSQVIATYAFPESLAGNWFAEAYVIRTAEDAQDYVAKLATIGAASVAINDIEQGTATQNDGAAITIKCTGEAVDNNDIVQNGLIVEFLN